MRPAFLEIDLSAIRDNLRIIRSMVSEHTAIAAIVKANAYGHGGPAVARACVEAGASMLCVAIVSEGIELREAGINEPILVLGPPDAEEAELYLEHDLIATLSDPEHARIMAAAAARVGGTARVHVKLDSGMGRYGARGKTAERLVRTLTESPQVRTEGVFSHFADACNPDLSWSQEQLRRFMAMLALFGVETGGDRPQLHIGNSAALIRMPEAHYDAVRPGAVLYGLNPGLPPELMPEGLRPALTLRSRIATLKTVEAGQPVGYNCTWRAERDSRIAVLPLGYADGYPRALSNNADVLIGGRRCPIVGVVSMDSITVDVTEAPEVKIGDEAVLIGAQGDEHITIEELAERAGTIVQEIAARLSPRLPRIYLNQEECA